jgi:periplasmic protein CpxP/Spy
MLQQQNKSKIFLFIIGILLLTNFVLLFFFLQEPKKDSHLDRRAYIAAFLKDEIGFDQNQLKQFDTLSSHHRENMKNIWDKTRIPKGEQFRQLAAGQFTDSAIDAVAEQSAKRQKTVELMMCAHLKNIRLLCKPEQLPKFDSLFGEALNKSRDPKKRAAK